MVKHIKIGGEKRPVRFSINALLEFEELTGLDVSEPEDRMKIQKMKNILALAYVGLKHGAKADHKVFETTLEQVGDWIDTSSQNKIFEAFTADNSASGESEEDEEGKKKLAGETSAQ